MARPRASIQVVLPQGSIICVTCCGVRAFQPERTWYDPVSPWTVPPGHSLGVAHGYINTPSRSESDGTTRVCGVAVESRRLSQFPKKKTRSFFTGPPTDAP